MVDGGRESRVNSIQGGDDVPDCKIRRCGKIRDLDDWVRYSEWLFNLDCVAKGL